MSESGKDKMRNFNKLKMKTMYQIYETNMNFTTTLERQEILYFFNQNHVKSGSKHKSIK